MPVVVLAPSASDNGLAIMLADLLRQNLEAKPHKVADFSALDARVAIVADDADVALTLVFDRLMNRLVIHDGIVGIPDVTIRGPSDGIIALSNVPLMTRFGLPLPSPRDREARRTMSDLLAMMRAGRLHAYGALLHVPMMMKLTRVMSVNG
jgi:hypothetical protein